jgi:hypothetical protein
MGKVHSKMYFTSHWRECCGRRSYRRASPHVRVDESGYGDTKSREERVKIIRLHFNQAYGIQPTAKQVKQNLRNWEKLKKV